MTNDEARPLLIEVADRLETIYEVGLSNDKGGRFQISHPEILAFQTALASAAAILRDGVSTSAETFIQALFCTHADSVLELHDTELTNIRKDIQEDDC